MLIHFKNPTRPNHKYSLECPLDWTILRVKQALHDVRCRSELTSCALLTPRNALSQDYIDSPLPADIKVIFAGQLLADSLLLSAVFEKVRLQLSCLLCTRVLALTRSHRIIV